VLTKHLITQKLEVFLILKSIKTLIFLTAFFNFATELIFYKMKEFFEAIAWLFEEVLFLPYNVLRELELNNWWLANSINWIFAIVIFSLFIYWTHQLKIFNDKGEENKDPSAHSFL
jgi:hypothetical protein